MAAAAPGTTARVRSGRKIPYLLLVPGMAFTFVFFVVPLITLLKISLSSKPDRLIPNYDFTWEWSNFSTAFTEFGGQLVRSFVYAGIATLLCLAHRLPDRLLHRLQGRAVAQHPARAGDGAVLHQLPAAHHRLADAAQRQRPGAQGDRLAARRGHPRLAAASLDDGRLLNTQVAVIGGLTYNFLPFMLLPIYVSLEKIDVRLVEAASDLYSSFRRTFRTVILPLSLPGIFAGTLLTFIPATGDFINASLLGNPQTSVIGNVVQTQFLNRNDYPTAAAISFVLMAIITALVLIYAKFLGTEDMA